MEKGKTILTTAAVALATTTIGAGVANADNVQTTSSNNVQAKASDKVTNADLNSAKQNVSSAKASASSAQANVNSAQSKVNADKQDVANKQATVSSAEPFGPVNTMRAVSPEMLSRASGISEQGTSNSTGSPSPVHGNLTDSSFALSHTHLSS